MSGAGDAAGPEDYAHFWESGALRRRWVIWNTGGESLVFDRETNCPVDIADESVLREVVRRMRRAYVPETDDYPGGPCA